MLPVELVRPGRAPDSDSLFCFNFGKIKNLLVNLRQSKLVRKLRVSRGQESKPSTYSLLIRSGHTFQCKMTTTDKDVVH